MTFKELLAKEKQSIVQFLESYINDNVNKFEDITFKKDLKTKLLIYTTQGKMIRGALVIVASKLFWNVDNKDIVNIAAAIELFQSAFLIQDDIMDEDDMRRGMTAIHKQYGPNRYGESMAMCLSDLAIFLGYDLLSKITKNTSKIVSQASKEIMYTAFGQMNDIDLENKKEITKEEVLKMYEHKTAHYTFIMPLMLSALYCDSGIDFEPLGKNMGLLFQIKDDMIGLLGNPEITGKPNDSDIKEKKSTLYRALLFEAANNEDKQIITDIFSKKKISDEHVIEIKNLISKYDIVPICTDKIKQYKDVSFDLIEKLDIIKEGKVFLKEFVIYLFEREK